MEKVSPIKDRLLNGIYLRLLAYKRMLMFLQADIKSKKKRKRPWLVHTAIKFLTIIYKSRSRDEELIKEAAEAAAFILSLKEKYSLELADHVVFTEDDDSENDEEGSDVPRRSKIKWKLSHETIDEISTNSNYPKTPRIVQQLITERTQKVPKPKIKKQRQTNKDDETASSLECPSTARIRWNLPEESSSEATTEDTTSSDGPITPKSIWKYLNGANLKMLEAALTTQTNFDPAELLDELKQNLGINTECITEEQSDKCSMEAGKSGTTIEVDTASNDSTTNKNVAVHLTTSTIQWDTSNDETLLESTITNKNVENVNSLARLSATTMNWEVPDSTSQQALVAGVCGDEYVEEESSPESSSTSSDEQGITDEALLETVKPIVVSEIISTDSSDHMINFAKVKSLAQLSAATINWEVSDETSLETIRHTGMSEVSSTLSSNAMINENVPKVNSLAQLSAATLNWEIPDSTLQQSLVTEDSSDEDIEEESSAESSPALSDEQDRSNEALLEAIKPTVIAEVKNTFSSDPMQNNNVAKVKSLSAATINWEVSDKPSSEIIKHTGMSDISNTVSYDALINENVAKVNSLERLSAATINWEISDHTSVKTLNPAVLTDSSSTFSSCVVSNDNIATVKSLGRLSASTVTWEISDETSLKGVKPGLGLLTKVSSKPLINENAVETSDLGCLSASTRNMEISGDIFSPEAIKQGTVVEAGTASSDSVIIENVEEESSLEYPSTATIEQKKSDKSSLAGIRSEVMIEVSTADSDLMISENIAEEISPDKEISDISAVKLAAMTEDGTGDSDLMIGENIAEEISPDKEISDTSAVKLATMTEDGRGDSDLMISENIAEEISPDKEISDISAVTPAAMTEGGTGDSDLMISENIEEESSLDQEILDVSSLAAIRSDVMIEVSTADIDLRINENIEEEISPDKEISDISAVKPAAMTEGSTVNSDLMVSENVEEESSSDQEISDISAGKPAAMTEGSTVNSDLMVSENVEEESSSDQEISDISAIKLAAMTELSTANSYPTIDKYVEKESNLECLSTIEEGKTDETLVETSAPTVMTGVNTANNDLMGNENVPEVSSLSNLSRLSSSTIIWEIPDKISPQAVKSTIVTEVRSDPMIYGYADDSGSPESSSNSSQEEETSDQISMKAVTTDRARSCPTINENDGQVYFEGPSTSRMKLRPLDGPSLQEFKPALTKLGSFSSRNPMTNEDDLQSNYFKRPSTSRVSWDPAITEKGSTTSIYPMTPRSIHKLLSGTQLKTLKPAVRQEIFSDLKKPNEEGVSNENGETHANQDEYPMTTGNTLSKPDTLPQSDLMSMLLRYKQKKEKTTDN